MRGRSKYHSKSFTICTGHVARLNGTQQIVLKRLNQVGLLRKKLELFLW